MALITVVLDHLKKTPSVKPLFNSLSKMIPATTCILKKMLLKGLDTDYLLNLCQLLMEMYITMQNVIF